MMLTIPKRNRNKKPRVVQALEWYEVRWFYKKNLEVEKVTPFSGYDSAVVEMAYRQQNKLYVPEDLASLPNIKSRAVLDGFFEVNNDVTVATPLYWTGEKIILLRGSWFYEVGYIPLPVLQADEIEEKYLEVFLNQEIPDRPVLKVKGEDTPTLCTYALTNTPGCKVVWNSVIDTKLIKESKKWFSGSKSESLKRGYVARINPDEGRPDYNHIIFVVHGIGQKGYENLISKNAATIRERVNFVMKDTNKYGSQRPLILPVEWRSTLKLDGGVIDQITLPKMRDLRDSLNSVAMDIMYYQSPIYRPDIIDSVIEKMNYAYRTYTERSKNNQIKVSIIGHSLGSVIIYDILTDDLVRQNLDFKVEYLFCLGSPLPTYITIRRKMNNFIPLDSQLQRMFNIFNPYDPVAYRLEPLCHKNYRYVRPIRIITDTESGKFDDFFDCPKSQAAAIDQYLQHPNDETGADDFVFAQIDDGKNELPVAPEDRQPRPDSPTSGNEEDIESTARAGLKNDKNTKAKQKEKLELSSQCKKLLEGIPQEKKVPYRLDFQLRTGMLARSYYAMLGAHFSYWANSDVAQFIVEILYPPIAEAEEANELINS